MFTDFSPVSLSHGCPLRVGRLLNEEYCAAKRLYSAFNIRSNNLSAALTAAAGAPARQLAQSALAPLVQVTLIYISSRPLH